MLVVATMKLPLADLSAGIALSALDVQGFSLRKGVDMAGLSSPLALGHWGDVEEAALMLSGICPHDSSVFLVLALHMESSVGEGVDKSVLLVVLVDVEDLSGSALVVRDGKPVVIVSEGEGLLEVEDTDDLIRIIGVGSEDEVLGSLHRYLVNKK